ncbi:hypothetical protein BpHYR1_011880 [Brachionus plicatilis]|uniref:Uncharacterized protein n=1 Tax=Brachionus plicatilis TaxID=10195 RepID=A0A3M7RQP3_BRAPC|nr:hypothetical protein BpHYR1_011880 [Brachionus plicatilis]
MLFTRVGIVVIEKNTCLFLFFLCSIRSIIISRIKFTISANDKTLIPKTMPIVEPTFDKKSEKCIALSSSTLNDINPNTLEILCPHIWADQNHSNPNFLLNNLGNTNICKFVGHKF